MSDFYALVDAFLSLCRTDEHLPGQHDQADHAGGGGGGDDSKAKRVAKPVDWFDASPDVVKRAATSSVTSIGQLSADEKKQLKKAVKAGQLMEIEDYTYPNPKKKYVLHPDYWSVD